MPVDVRFFGQHLHLHLYRTDFQIVDIGIQNAALFPGAAEQKVDGRHFQHLHISVVTGVDDPMFDLLDGKIVHRRLYPSGTSPMAFEVVGLRRVILFGRLGYYSSLFEEAEKAEDKGGKAFSRYADKRDEPQRQGCKA